ncbi:MAG: NUDIX domain-containing protein [Candidatus Liptonbacteria bacterium]|nr:NUDIX domain-containing protein [Candidatus Liptonbacteria bacterium]
MPRIVIVEGLWGIGKSTLISAVRRRLPILFISEPSYLISGIKSDISRWYREEHDKQLRLAKKYAEYGENVILERSILSSVAFHYAQHRVLPAWFTASNIKSLSSPELRIFFLHGDKRSFSKTVPTIWDRSVRRAVFKNPDFYENYLRFFRKVAPCLIASKIICIKAESNDRVFTAARQQIIDFLRDAPKAEKRLKETVFRCASAIAVYRNKFLLIYSRRHRYYSLPQGHRSGNENLNQTALRELREETGFYDAKIIAPIDTYNYRFYLKKTIVRKEITCILVKLNSLKRISKAFERHESYINFFYSPKDAEKKLRWAEDKSVVNRAREIIGMEKVLPPKG